MEEASVSQTNVSGALSASQIEATIADQWSKGSMFILNICKKQWTLRTAAEDLGLSVDSIPKNVRLGNKLMLPEKPVNNINNLEGQARAILDRSSYLHPVGCRFVKHEHMVDLAIKLEAKCKEFMAAVDHLVENYDKYKEQMARELPAQYAVMEQFYPPVHVWRPCYSFQVKSWVLHYKGQVAEADLESEIKRRNLDAEHAKNLRDSFIKQNQQYAADMAEFAESTMKTLRSQATSAFTQIIKRWETNKAAGVYKINTRTVNRLNEIITQFREMEVLPDVDFRTRLQELQKRIESRDGAASQAEAMASIQEIMQDAVKFDLEHTARQSGERSLAIKQARRIII